MRRLLLVTAAAGLALTACGSSKSDTGAAATTATTAGASATTAAATATTGAAATATTAAATATTKAAAATTAAAAATTAAAAATTAAATTAAAATVELKEWSVAAAGLKAGAVSIAVKNSGENPHELLILKADSYESLAKGSGGAVDESKLAAGAVVARTERIDGGKTATLSATLPAGKYVFVCNLGFGAQSHAGKGQHADVTVA